MLPIFEMMEFEKNTDFIVDKTRISTQFDNIDFVFQSKNSNSFKIKSFWMPINNNLVFHTESKLLNYLMDELNNKVLFLVHPLSEKYFSECLVEKPGPIFNALSTSSIRTLLVHPENNTDLLFFAKLGLDKTISNMHRVLNKDEVNHSIATTQLLDFHQEKLPPNFKYLREVLGVFLLNSKGGMIIREIPSFLLEKNNRDRKLIPFFSLYTKQKTDKYPLLDMLKKSELTLQTWLKEKLLIPFAKQFIFLAINGIITECHGQNILLELSDENFTGNFYYRDFDGFSFDCEYRKKIGLINPENIVYIEDIEKIYSEDYFENSINQNLYLYFEGGILFGISEITKPEISYYHLINIFRIVLIKELSNYGVKTDINLVYKDMYKNILEIRKRI